MKKNQEETTEAQRETEKKRILSSLLISQGNETQFN